MDDYTDAVPKAQVGRPRSIDYDHVALVALQLFVERGYAECTMDDVARVSGVSRRSLFRIFASKEELAWGGMLEASDRLRRELVARRARPLPEAVAEAYATVMDFSGVDLELARTRLRLISMTPDLLAASVVRIEPDRRALVAYCTERLPSLSRLQAEVLGSATGSAVFRALLWWVRQPDGMSMSETVRQAVHLVLDGVTGGAGDQRS